MKQMTDTSKPLSGVVSKAPLLVAPCFAQEKELVHYIKYKLYEQGFIVVREEFRPINPELSEKLCVKVDYVPRYLKKEEGLPAGLGIIADENGGNEGTPMLASNPSALPTMKPKDMVGTAYVFILARSDCHSRLQRFLEYLTTKDSEFRAMVSRRREALMGVNKENDTEVSIPLVPVMANATADGAREAVNLLFPQMLGMDIPTDVRAREYVQANLKIALLSSLTELAKTKPAKPLEWLAHRLLETNIQAPPMERT